jgi:hypothetical protein
MIIGTTEAVGMVRNIIASVQEISADCLPDCTSERYDLSKNASIKPTKKCANCVLKSASSCIKQSINFSGNMDLDKAFFDIREAGEEKLPKEMETIQYKENPDKDREDITQEYDMTTAGGSGMNVVLDDMHKKDMKEASELGIEMGGCGLDNHL